MNMKDIKSSYNNSIVSKSIFQSLNSVCMFYLILFNVISTPNELFNAGIWFICKCLIMITTYIFKFL